MRKSGVIMSGSYIAGTLRSEYGMLPPSMLRINDNVLLSEQVTFLQSQGVSQIYLTLPTNYLPDKWLYDYIFKQSIKVLYSNPSSNIVTSLEFLLFQMFNLNERDVVVIYGDTLVNVNKNISPNTIFTAFNDYEYEWGKLSNDQSKIFTGCFRIDVNLNLLNIFTSDKFGSAENLLNKIFDPSSSVMIDNERWLDFGHLNTYYDSIGKSFKPREFNEIKVAGNKVYKSSNDVLKIQAEFRWYQSIPNLLNKFSPRIYGIEHNNGQELYAMEYLRLPSLQTILIYGRVSESYWTNVFISCFEFIKLSKNVNLGNINYKSFNQFLISKTEDRISDIQFKTKSQEFRIKQFIDRINKYLLSNSDYIESMKSYAHGDFCFSNILFDVKYKEIRLIDPRGVFDNCNGHFNQLYDLAKLLHSVYGKYDSVVCGIDGKKDNNPTEFYDHYNSIFQRSFNKQLRGNFDDKAILIAHCVVVHLFVSMVPLHKDCTGRQFSFLKIAEEYYLERVHDYI